MFIGTLMEQPFEYDRIAEVCEKWYAGSLDVRFENGESGAEVVTRHREQFEEIADLHRGETVLVVGHQTALGIVVPTLTGVDVAWARENELANTESIELAHDAHGWVLRRWGSEVFAPPA